MPFGHPVRRAWRRMRSFAGLLGWLPSVLIVFALAANHARGAQQAEIYSLSLRFHPATVAQGSTTWQLDLTSGAATSPANGELALAVGENNFTHSGFMFLSNSATGRAFYPLSLNIPTDDLNRDGMFDVLEQGVVTSVPTTGYYIDEAQNTHVIRATWNKPAGAYSGSCDLELPDLGVTFKAVFENFHYSGTYSYSKAGSSLTGEVSTHRNGVSASTLDGSLNLQIISESLLAWGIGQWRTEIGGIIEYEGSDLDRSALLEYSAFYVANDGDLTTAEPDYQTWLFVLPNIPDTNNNGIPDLIEGTDVAAEPRLTLTFNGTALTLTVTGGKGRTFDLETTTEVSGAAGAAWTKLSRHTFATDSETIPVEFSRSGNAFWRLRE